MSILSKIFIVLLCVLTIALSVSVVIVQRDYLQWKAHAQTLQQELNVTKAGYAVQESIWKDSKVALLKQIADLEKGQQETQADVSRARQEVKTKETEILLLEKRVQAAELAATNARQSAAAAEKEADEIRNQYSSQNTKYTDLQNKYRQTNEELTKSQAENEYLLRQVKLQRQEIEQLKELAAAAPAEGAGKVTPVVAGPPIKGEIVAVGEGMATINVGKADGVQAGMRFTVFRGPTYLAMLTITRVEDDKAVGRLDLQKSRVQLHDSAWNKLDAF